jgi:hypothetical protein
VFGASLYLASTVRRPAAARPRSTEALHASAAGGGGHGHAHGAREVHPVGPAAGLGDGPQGSGDRTPPGERYADLPPEARKPDWVPIVEPKPEDTYDNSPETLIRPPAGGFDAWTGLEGTHPNQLNIYVRSEGTTLELGKELRRLYWETTLTQDFNLLMDIRGGTPLPLAEAQELSRIAGETFAKGEEHYEAVRAGRLGNAEAIALIRQLEVQYRDTYMARAGITREQFDRFFEEGRWLPNTEDVIREEIP